MCFLVFGVLYGSQIEEYCCVLQPTIFSKSYQSHWLIWRFPYVASVCASAHLRAQYDRSIKLSNMTLVSFTKICRLE